MALSPEEIVKKFIKGNQRHPAYLEAVDIENHLSFHIDGFNPNRFRGLKEHEKAFARAMGMMDTENPYFQLLIDERRPGESLKVQLHRRKIYSSITKEPCFKVISSLNKIVRSDDWKIDYSNSETIKQEGENLEDYAEKNYPGFGSVTNWAYTLGLKKILSDPNGFMVVLPLEFMVDPNQFLRPFANYIPSKDVLFYEPGVMIAYKSSHVGELKIQNQVKTVPIYRIISTEGVWEAMQVNEKGDFSLTPLMAWDMDLPVVMNGGVLDKLINNIPLYNSFLNPMLPRLDEAAREYSDMQAEVLLHIHSTLAVIQGEKCIKCKGTGLIPKPGGAVSCGDCGGRGAAAVDPYETIVVRVRDADKQQIPFPPAQYITKSTDIVKIQDERIDAHIFKSLSSINMEFLAETPLNQSGKAKEVDKEELNNFVYSIAFHLVKNFLNPIYKIISDYRYSVLIPNQEKRNKLLPLIQVPEQFDLLTENTLIEQIGKAKEAGIDATIIQEMQVDYVNKKFRDAPEIRNQLITSMAMNPFPTLNAEQLIELEMNHDITKEDAVMSTYATYFVEKAVEADPTFLEKSFEERLTIIRDMTDEKIKELEADKPEPVPVPPIPPVEE
ncbi:hypothetical protein LCGC14_0388530 [marine sediment metagenome]|uniref:Uncharacterized protein n=1 Tax=marine sediment metagenome TaxID=412755 RepID=A0A0F9VMD1_9ZZZZ